MTPTDTRVITTIMAGVLHGLHAAHEAVSEQGEPLNIVHRDVSPQNIIVGVDGVARLLDFGVARAVGRLQTTRQGQLKGKIAYMAPEQLHDQRVTRQSDIYAAAVVTWEALTGQRLFTGDNQAALATAVLQAPVQPPSQVAPHVPLSLDRVVMRGLERDAARRYASAREMALDMERGAGGVAPASEIGTWVESLARDELSRRATQIAEIEMVSSSSVSSRRTLADPEDMPTVATSSPLITNVPHLADLLSDESSIVVKPPIIATLPRASGRRLTLWASVGAGAFVVTLAFLRLSGFASRDHASSSQPVPSASSAPAGGATSGAGASSGLGGAAAPLPTPPSSQSQEIGQAQTPGPNLETIPVGALPLANSAPTSPPPSPAHPPRRRTPPKTSVAGPNPVGAGAPTDKTRDDDDDDDHETGLRSPVHSR